MDPNDLNNNPNKNTRKRDASSSPGDDIVLRLNQRARVDVHGDINIPGNLSPTTTATLRSLNEQNRLLRVLQNEVFPGHPSSNSGGSCSAVAGQGSAGGGIVCVESSSNIGAVSLATTILEATNSLEDGTFTQLVQNSFTRANRQDLQTALQQERDNRAFVAQTINENIQLRNNLLQGLFENTTVAMSRVLLSMIILAFLTNDANDTVISTIFDQRPILLTIFNIINGCVRSFVRLNDSALTTVVSGGISERNPSVLLAIPFLGMTAYGIHHLGQLANVDIGEISNMIQGLFTTDGSLTSQLVSYAITNYLYPAAQFGSEAVAAALAQAQAPAPAQAPPLVAPDDSAESQEPVGRVVANILAPNPLDIPLGSQSQSTEQGESQESNASSQSVSNSMREILESWTHSGSHSRSPSISSEEEMTGSGRSRKNRRRTRRSKKRTQKGGKRYRKRTIRRRARRTRR